MTKRIQIADLSIATELNDIFQAALPGSGITEEKVYTALATLAREFGPRNKDLLAVRDKLQAKLDAWHRGNSGQPDTDVYHAFLREIGYLVPEGDDFSITTSGVDPEIGSIAGPQLVVPATIARFALNAANARWGSLYDALYGSDVLPGLAASGGYDSERGKMVMDYASNFLDTALPLLIGSHKDVTEYVITDYTTGKGVTGLLANGSASILLRAEQFVGYEEDDELRSLLFTNNGLLIELQFDRDHPVGAGHPAGVKDVVLESALTTIVDCEDSVAVVDSEDKALAYKNLLGLVKGDLTASFKKSGETVTRTLHPDRTFRTPLNTTLTLPGQSLMLVRTVGHLMTTDAVLDSSGNEIPEGILDTLAVGLIFSRDLRGPNARRNSRKGSIYIVKPKMHGPQEVQFTCDLFARTEELLGLPSGCLKIGIMDEERRTTLNLKECIRAAKDRVIFINTGFLDRTGDEIHTSMEAGPVTRKEDIKSEPWLAAYEDWNVDTGLACGFSGRAQIGKGMWPKPDMLKEMVETKTAHPMAGANCAWVPSPTAATLHAMQYHEVDVFKRQAELASTRRAGLETLTTLPLMTSRPSAEEITTELENNCQSILGYVVRWIDQGIGCSKVPDITGTGLMEDRATLRISSQHLANWLRHEICTEDAVLDALMKMAKIVDEQNASDPAYTPMAADFDNNIAFQAAHDLIILGAKQPNGYTEPILHARRREAKRK